MLRASQSKVYKKFKSLSQTFSFCFKDLKFKWVKSIDWSHFLKEVYKYYVFPNSFKIFSYLRKKGNIDSKTDILREV